ncbi:hypothetical protein [Marisediminicola senii]|uniref:hypothetical protein n=1 Tax=Marisediminicola senii TaxID=2711233 RepID=UPI0013ED3283|nr:hypothetical protein [Marisediminicola senii]
MTDLGLVILPPDHASLDAATVLRDTLVRGLRARLVGIAAAVEFADDRNEARTADIVNAIENHSSDDTLFEHRLQGMHPLRAKDIRELRQDWEGAVRWLGVVTNNQDRFGLLKRWAASPPEFAGAPPELFGILADLAADLPSSRDTAAISSKFVEVGLERGIQPQGYWAVRFVQFEELHDLSEATEFLHEYRGYPLVEAGLHPDGPDAAIALLEAWSPQTDKEELHRLNLLTEYYLRNLKVDEAIETGQAAYKRFQSTASAMQAARAMTLRHMMHGSVANKNDLPNALLLAVKARADRRRWGVDSGPALALEIRVRRMLSDYDGALDLVTGASEYAATEIELADPQVLSETALLQAERGDIEIAKRLVSSAPEAQQPRILAVIADQEGRREDAASFWAAAIDATDELGEQADYTLQLALHGIESKSVIERLESDNAEVAAEIRETAALFGHEPGALERFRGFANANFRGALFLYFYLQQEDDEAAAAEWAHESGLKWSDPDLLIQSALFYGRDKRFAESIADINAALLAGSDDWGGRRRAFRLLLEAHSSAGDWNQARAAAASFVAEEPDNPSAAWALVICHIQLLDFDRALRSWQQHGSPQPRSEMEVEAWIQLLGKFGTVVGSSSDALEVSTRFAGSEEIRSALLSVYFHQERPDADVQTRIEGELDEDINPLDPDASAFREMLGSYLRDFPNGAIRQVSIDVADPLAALRDQFKDQPDTLELDEQISSGALPVGLAGEVYGKSYLESLLSRERGPVFTGHSANHEEEIGFSVAHTGGAVVDLSALVTLARLPEGIRMLLAGHFPSVRALREHKRDVLLGGPGIVRDSGLSYQPPRGGAPEVLVRRTPDEIAARTSLVASVEASFSRLALVSHPRVTNIPLTEEFTNPFLLGADLSLSLAVPFWVDDAALVDVVRAEGGKAFGTPQLLHHLREEGPIDPSMIDLAEATLIAAGYVNLRFRASVWELAVSLASSPIGLVNAVRHANNDNGPERLKAALRLVDSHAGEPDFLVAFVSATAQWLEATAISDDAASQNVTVLARELLGRSWMSSSTLPYCVGAFRAVSGRVDGVTILLREIYRTFQSIADRANDRDAALVIFDLVSRLDAKDGLRVRAAVLARRFD